MKIEDIQYEFSEKEIDEEGFDIEKWRIEHPMDYFKAMYLINNYENKDEIFNIIYRISRYHIPDTLFKYYSLTDDEHLNKQKLETLKQQKIFMSDVENLNDPFDNKAYFYNHEVLKKYDRLKSCDGKLIDDFSKFNKVTSLTAAGIHSMPMWAHYSNNHKGFCVSYDMKNNVKLSGTTFPIQYTDERIDITSLMDKQVETMNEELNIQMKKGPGPVMLSDLTLIYLQSFFCNIKHISWNYEKEFRCSMGQNIGSYMEATPKEIYIGLKCSNTHKKELEKIAKELKIPIHEMKFDELDEKFNLVSKKLKFI